MSGRGCLFGLSSSRDLAGTISKMGKWKDCIREEGNVCGWR